MSIMALAMSGEGMKITESESVTSGKQPEPRERTPFNKKKGVLKMIEDYNLIKQGKSKKGIIKQSRIKNKVDEWLKSGKLSESDIESTI